jgi:hypothetical protein
LKCPYSGIELRIISEKIRCDNLRYNKAISLSYVCSIAAESSNFQSNLSSYQFSSQTLVFLHTNPFVILLFTLLGLSNVDSMSSPSAADPAHTPIDEIDLESKSRNGQRDEVPNNAINQTPQQVAHQFPEGGIKAWLVALGC